MVIKFPEQLRNKVTSLFRNLLNKEENDGFLIKLDSSENVTPLRPVLFSKAYKVKLEDICLNEKKINCAAFVVLEFELKA